MFHYRHAAYEDPLDRNVYNFDEMKFAIDVIGASKIVTGSDTIGWYRLTN